MRALQHAAPAGFFVGFFVFVCVLALGGPTGIAANPARDFGPRLAHAVLPIAGGWEGSNPKLTRPSRGWRVSEERVGPGGPPEDGGR